MKYLTLILTMIISLSSCNIKEAKNHDTSVASVQSTEDEKEKINTATVKEYDELDSDQMSRNELWNIAVDNDIDIEDRLTSIENFFLSFNEHFNQHSSHYTILVLKNEFFKKLEYFADNIKRLSKINVNKNHINTRRGKLKDIYIHFVGQTSQNSFLYESIITEDYLKRTNKNVSNHLLRQIAEIKIINSLFSNNEELIIENLTSEEMNNTLSNLEEAAQMKSTLIEKDFKFILNKSIKNKVRTVQISEFQLDTNQDALQIQKYIDLFLN